MEPPEAEPAPETLDFLADWGRSGLERQLAAADALDAKITQALAAGSILLGLPALAGAPDCALVALPLSGAVAAFGVLAFYAVRALWVRKFRTPLGPDLAWNTYRSYDLPAIKRVIAEDASEGYEENSGLIGQKAAALRWALPALGFEALFVGAAVIASAAS
jgi:hypothetical protein